MQLKIQSKLRMFKPSKMQFLLKRLFGSQFLLITNQLDNFKLKLNLFLITTLPLSALQFLKEEEMEEVEVMVEDTETTMPNLFILKMDVA